MTKKKYIIKILFIIIITLISMASNSVEAEEKKSLFYVKAVLPNNQLPDTMEYFHIQTDKNLDQALEIVIVNESQEDKEFTLTILDGMTTDAGEISYNIEHIYDKSQKIKLSENSNVSSTVAVKSQDSLVVPINLAIALDNFSGQLLGAVNVSEKKSTDENTVGVVNQFAYNIPIKIDVKTSQIKAILNYYDIKVIEQEGSSDLKMDFSNSSATIIRDLSLEYTIEYLKDDKIVIDEITKGLELAPTSHFSPTIITGSKPLKAGKYKISIKATSEINDINEKWTDEFTISSSETKRINEGLSVEKAGIAWYIWLTMILVIILLIAVMVQKYRQKRKKQAKKNRRKVASKRT